MRDAKGWEGLLSSADEFACAVHESRRPWMLCVYNIKGLQRINTEVGVSAGDEVITHLARRVTQAAPSHRIVFGPTSSGSVCLGYPARMDMRGATYLLPFTPPRCAARTG